MKKNMSKFEATMMACRKKSLKENKKKFEDEEDLPDDTIDVDDAVVVVDPELSADDYEDNLDALQDIVDDTEEDEEPVTTDYIGKLIYVCPTCGNNFFSDSKVEDDSECPVCGETVSKFILVGEVKSPEDAAEDYPDPESDDYTEEPFDDEGDIEEVDSETDDQSEEPKEENFSIDEKSFNTLLTKFVRENYKNVRSMKVSKATTKGKNLKLECNISMKSGNTKKSIVTIRDFKYLASRPVKFEATLDKAFKVESKGAPLAITTKMQGRRLKALKADYSFTSIKEGRRVKVCGKCIND